MPAHRRLLAAMKPWPLASLVMMTVMASAAHADLEHYFIAVDSLETLTSGDYTGLLNPNVGRLTFLYAHTNDDDPSSNHFHGIGAYSYTGPVDNPEVVPTNSNNRIPEGFSEEPPLRLFPGTGAHAFTLLSKRSESEYSHLLIESIQSLSEFDSDTPEGYLFNSSAGRWRAPLTGTVVALELVEVTNGLHIADEHGKEILTNVGRTEDDDIIYGLGGDNVIVGKGGNDLIYAGAGDDIAFGGLGDDSIDGGEGLNRIFGGPGENSIVGGYSLLTSE